MDTELAKRFIKEEITMTASEANKRGFYLMLPIMAIVFTPYYVIWAKHLTAESVRQFTEESKQWYGYGTALIIVVMIAGIIMHELIHGVTWAMYSKNGFRSIRFGVHWRELTPYCHCTEPLLVRQYIVGASMPGIMLGLIPSLLSYITGNLWLMLFGVFFTVAAAGDLMIIDIIRRERLDDLVQDHPEKIGCYIFRRAK